MKKQTGAWYLIAYNDDLELPLFYARTAQEVADYLGVTVKAVYKCFIRAKRKGIGICKGYQIERVWIDNEEDI